MMHPLLMLMILCVLVCTISPLVIITAGLCGKGLPNFNVEDEAELLGNSIGDMMSYIVARFTKVSLSLFTTRPDHNTAKAKKDAAHIKAFKKLTKKLRQDRMATRTRPSKAMTRRMKRALATEVRKAAVTLLLQVTAERDRLAEENSALAEDIATLAEDSASLKDHEIQLEKEAKTNKERLGTTTAALKVADSNVRMSFFKLTIAQRESRDAITQAASRVSAMQAQVARAVVDPAEYRRALHEARTYHNERDDARAAREEAVRRQKEAEAKEDLLKVEVAQKEEELKKVQEELAETIRHRTRAIAKAEARANASDKKTRAAERDARRADGRTRNVEESLKAQMRELQHQNNRLEQRLQNTINYTNATVKMHEDNLSDYQVRRLAEADAHDTEIAHLHKEHEHELWQVRQDYVAELAQREKVVMEKCQEELARMQKYAEGKWQKEMARIDQEVDERRKEEMARWEKKAEERLKEELSKQADEWAELSEETFRAEREEAEREAEQKVSHWKDRALKAEAELEALTGDFDFNAPFGEVPSTGFPPFDPGEPFDTPMTSGGGPQGGQEDEEEEL